MLSTIFHFTGHVQCAYLLHELVSVLGVCNCKVFLKILRMNGSHVSVSCIFHCIPNARSCPFIRWSPLCVITCSIVRDNC